jgi:hypothetical protein
MKHSKAVLLVLLLVLLPGVPEAAAQQTDNSAAPQDTLPREEHGLELEQNYPNPFSDETRIPLVLGVDLFEDGRPVIVTARIYNVLRQPVAVPAALDHPMGSGQPASELRYAVTSWRTARKTSSRWSSRAESRSSIQSTK